MYENILFKFCGPRSRHYAEPVVLFEIHRHPKRLRNSPCRFLKNGASLLRNRLFLPTLHFLVTLVYIWPDSLIPLPLKFQQILDLDVGILWTLCSRKLHLISLSIYLVNYILIGQLSTTVI